ncbi:MAG: FAD-binding protein [Candidatus Dormibacteraeota bacterium]|uniref:FAD-binding protein n=1 Tax=Candidatus Amunia macphersoniae TaxID=3127014 RepID=A0A934KL50_9BACT|nr:FAD-binding protein [Candidatus Dormibacteraeota bacterium]
MAAESYTTHECDVLVVGAGGAGMRAAIAAAQAGCSTIVVTKSLLGKAHTVMAEGGIAAGLGNVDAQDSWEVHFADTMLGGQLLNNWRMVELYAHEVVDRVYELERWGGLFDRTDDGRIMQRAFGAHSWRRLAHVGDRTGLELIRTCQDRLVHTARTECYMEYTLTRLLKDGDRVVGAMGYNRNDGRFVVIKAGAVVLGSGGWGRMYRYTSNSWEGTGDGAAMAYDAGAELLDMEFVQFHPTGMVWPPGARGILVTEAVRGEGGLLYNSEHKRFMLEYDPVKKELSSRDVVARSIYKEVKAGRGSPHGGALLDITHRGADYIKKKLPSMYEQFHALASVDITREAMEVGPTIHYTMGGVRVDAETAATTVPGLYAAGEVAGGLHGANRLGGNSLGDILVFGRRAGVAAAEFARTAGTRRPVIEHEVEEEQRALLAPLQSGNGNAPGENPYHLHEALQAAMQDDAGIGRSEESLHRALAAILELRERSRSMRVSGGRVLNPGWHTCRDVTFMLTVSEAIVRSAIQRCESRGSQWRFDHLEQDEEQGKVNYVARRDGDTMTVGPVPLAPLPAHLVSLLTRSRFYDPAKLPKGHLRPEAMPAAAKEST